MMMMIAFITFKSSLVPWLSSGTSVGTFPCPVGPYINTVPKQVRKTNLTCFLYPFKTRGRKSVLTALVIPLHKSWAGGMGISVWITPFSENFEGMARGLGIWKNCDRTNLKKQIGCRSASESLFARILGTFFGVLISENEEFYVIPCHCIWQSWKTSHTETPSQGRKMSFWCFGNKIVTLVIISPPPPQGILREWEWNGNSWGMANMQQFPDHSRMPFPKWQREWTAVGVCCFALFY